MNQHLESGVSFKFCRTMPEMDQCIDAALTAEDDMVLWQSYNFPADIPLEVHGSWGHLITNYKKTAGETQKTPMENVGYHMVLDLGVETDRFGNFRNCVDQFLKENLEETYKVVAYHFDNNSVRAHVLIHAITTQRHIWDPAREGLPALQNSWHTTCKQYGIPLPTSLRTPQ